MDSLGQSSISSTDLGWHSYRKEFAPSKEASFSCESNIQGSESKL